MHGKRSLEGTFLGGCVFSARLAAGSIAETTSTRQAEAAVTAL
jgi:predicted oxidoreductase